MEKLKLLLLDEPSFNKSLRELAVLPNDVEIDLFFNKLWSKFYIFLGDSLAL